MIKQRQGRRNTPPPHNLRDIYREHNQGRVITNSYIYESINIIINTR